MTIVCLGGVVLDRVFELPEIPRDPIKITATGFRETGGGVAATAAVAIAALGGAAEFWSRVGDDSAGDWLAADLEKRGVGVAGLLRARGGRTGVSAVLVDPAGERLIAVATFAGDAAVSALPLDQLKTARVVLADARWPEGVEALFDGARARAIPRVADVDVGEESALLRLAAGADHAIFAASALRRLSGSEDPEAGLDWAQRRCTGLVAVTLGPQGALWRMGREAGRQPAFEVAARDTTGAGDVFHGAYALALGEGRDVPEAMRFAAAAAALKCARGAGWGGMPDRAGVDQILKEGRLR